MIEERQAWERVYLLRLWQESAGVPWHASLLSTATGERRGFGSLESLYAFLYEQARLETPGERGEEGA